MSAAPPPPATPYQGQTQLSPADEKLWATLLQLGGLFFGFLAPLIGYLVLKDRGPFVRHYAATALNFQLTLLIVTIIGSILTIVLVGFLILFAAWLVGIVFSIIAAVKANRGEWYQYPATIRFFS